VIAVAARGQGPRAIDRLRREPFARLIVHRFVGDRSVMPVAF
jgi:hypothetical protein